MSDTPLTIIAITTAKPGKEAALGAAQERLVTETLAEDGCLRYELHQSLDGALAAGEQRGKKREEEAYISRHGVHSLKVGRDSSLCLDKAGRGRDRANILTGLFKPERA